MYNKKALSGLKWIFLLISFFISVGILYFQIFTANIPKIGEYSVGVIKSQEKRNNLPIIMERLLTDLNENTINEFDENRVFTLKSYCEEDYKQSLIDKTFNPPTWLSKRDNVKCMIDESELIKYYEEAFEEDYNQFKSKDFSEIDLSFSDITYTSSVEKENDDFFNIVKTDDKFEFPINIRDGREKKQVGKFYLNPSFKIPVGYPFDDENKEVCILSRDCGATCNDIINIFDNDKINIFDDENLGSENPLKIKEFSCNEYFDCNEGPRDDFGNEFLCEDGTLCNGRCPDCECTGWQDISCGIDPSILPPNAVPANPCSTDEVFQVRTCKHETCGLDESQCVFDSCCADPICCGNYPPSCDCGGETCCTQDSSLCSPPPEPEQEETGSGLNDVAQEFFDNAGIDNEVINSLTEGQIDFINDFFGG